MSTRTPDTSSAASASPDAERSPNRAKKLIAGIAATAIGLTVGGVAYKQLSGHEDGRDVPSVSTTKTPPVPKNTDSPTPSPQKSETASPNTPKLLEQLPGYGQKVSEQERAMLRASTVKIAERQKGGPEDNWVGDCSGLKVDIGGSTYVVSARHCFNEVDMNELFPSLSNGADPATAPDLHEAKDITKELSVDVGIWTAGPDGAANEQALTPVSDVSVRYNPDIALLKVDTNSPGAAAFNKLPAISYTSNLSEKPVPGVEVAISSMPVASGEAMVESTGWYLGRVHNPGDPAQLIDLVGINPSSPAEDGCNFGASGSVAVFAGGSLSGPLSTRNNISNPVGTNGTDDPALDGSSREVMATQLGIAPEKLGDFATICGYGVVTPDIVQGMAH